MCVKPLNCSRQELVVGVSGALLILSFLWFSTHNHEGNFLLVLQWLDFLLLFSPALILSLILLQGIYCCLSVRAPIISCWTVVTAIDIHPIWGRGLGSRVFVTAGFFLLTHSHAPTEFCLLMLPPMVVSLLLFFSLNPGKDWLVSVWCYVKSLGPQCALFSEDRR